jgi:CzcA family heavy metal efflux pump
MFDRIIKFSLQHRGLVLTFGLITMLWGGWTIIHLPIDVFPDLNKPTVTILTEAGGLAPEEVETLVTLPIEVNVNGTPGLTRLRSSSGVGLSVIWLEFEWGSDIFRNRQLIAEKLSLVQDQLPKDVRPVMGPISSIMGEIQLVGLSSTDPDISPLQLRTIADWVIRPRLLSIGGVAQVIPIGGGLRQYQILLSSEKLRSRNLSLEEVKENLSHISQNTTGGFVDLAKQEYLIRNLGRVSSSEDINSSMVGLFAGRPVQVQDVATVVEGPKVKRGDASVNASPSVILSVQKQPGTSTTALTESIKTSLDQIQKSLPPGVKINSELFKQADFIEHSIENVQDALRDGAILVTIIIFMFLLNARATLITLLALPLSFSVTAISFKFLDIQINTMTLGGLAIAVGLLVDDAIVDVENVFRRLRENGNLSAPKPLLRVIFEASSEVRNSIVFATIIVVLVFLPLFWMGGLEGRFFTPLGIAFVVSLVASLIVSLTVTPVLCSYLFTNPSQFSHEEDGWLVRKLKALDKPLVEKFIDRPGILLIPVIGCFLLSMCIVPFFAKEFLPKFNEGTAMVSITLTPGVSLAYSDKVGLSAEKAILTVPEVKSVSRRTGRAELDEHAEGVNISEIGVDFKPGGRPREEVLENIRQVVKSAAPEASVNLGQPISHKLDALMSGVNFQIAIKVFGEDRDQLRSIAGGLLTELQKVEGIVDAQVEQQIEIPQIKVQFLREEALPFGVNVGQVASLLEMALKGEVVAQVLEGQRIIDVFMRFDDLSRSEIERIKKVAVRTMPDGSKITLDQVADVFDSTGPNMINRENMQRRIVVMANTSGRGMDKIMSDVQSNIEKNVQLPEGYYLTYGGQFEGQEKASRTMLILGSLALIAVFLLLYSQFKSCFIALQIMLNIPLALIGSVVAIALSDRTISIASMVAFVTLCGIASRNGIMMISHYLHLMSHEGEEFSKSMVIRGTLERLAPVLMTALAAILGLIPLVLSKGAPGKEILHPVAVVIVGGLLSSTILDMWVTPAVFYRFGKRSAEKFVALSKEKKGDEL